VGRGGGLDVVVLEKAAGTIHFERCQRRLLVGGDAVLAEGAFPFVHADMLSRHVGFEHLAIVDQKARFSLNILPEAAVGAGSLGYQIVQDQQRRGGYRAAGQRGAGPVMAFCTEFESGREASDRRESSGRLRACRCYEFRSAQEGR
jgi:hypothetical protein